MLCVCRYTKEFFPPNYLLTQYLKDFVEYYNLNIQYNTKISDITPPNAAVPGSVFGMRDQHGNTYNCKVLIMATGYSKEKKVTFPGSEHVEYYSDTSVNPDDFEGLSVLILGRGNSAFETADNILSATNFVHMLARSRVKLSWETHYVGDLRAVNNGLLDTYQLKSLDGIIERQVERLEVVKLPNGKLHLNMSETELDKFSMREDYDKIISCLGFEYDFSAFNQSGPHPLPHMRYTKFPHIQHTYESVQVPGLFFAGTSTHSLDFRKSAGGFIHGFRYTTRALFNLLEWRFEGVPWPSVTLSWMDMVPTIVKRINEASATYQMFSVLGDIILINDEDKTFRMLKEFPVKLLADIHKHTGWNGTRIIVMLFEYGPDFSGPGKDIFRETRAIDEPSEAHQSNFLHPTFYYYDKIPTEEEMNAVERPEVLPTPVRLHHIVEDFLTEFDAQISHILPLRRFIETSLDSDLRHKLSEECFELSLTHQTPPLACQVGYLRNMGLDILSM
ncbi:hypothetical protein EB796_005078 [Bugula neritina]|uniref:Uncharacterized protein n=1 Tax=Bugula neritina TaxID=10212 RepID=A0A7J7KFH8_BUGNE|nr:hypothetical protein EB796_005078 [Bugula neritina]